MKFDPRISIDPLQRHVIRVTGRMLRSYRIRIERLEGLVETLRKNEKRRYNTSYIREKREIGND